MQLLCNPLYNIHIYVLWAHWNPIIIQYSFPISSQETLHSSISNSNTVLYAINIYMSCELTGLPSQFNTQLQWAHKKTLLSSIFNSHTVSHTIYTCPVSSLDSHHDSIHNSNERTGDHPEFNIQLQWAHRRPSIVQYSTPIQSFIQYIHVLWAHWTSIIIQYSTPMSSQETLRSSIFNSYTVPYTT